MIDPWLGSPRLVDKDGAETYAKFAELPSLEDSDNESESGWIAVIEELRQQATRAGGKVSVERCPVGF